MKKDTLTIVLSVLFIVGTAVIMTVFNPSLLK